MDLGMGKTGVRGNRAEREIKVCIILFAAHQHDWKKNPSC